jgi:hypothetical protein
MNQGKMVFAQVMQFASQDILKNIVRRHEGDYKKHSFTSWKHFLCMAFGQLTHRESMSDTMLMLKLNEKKLYHLGIGTAFDKATISRTNESRSWIIFEEFGLKLIEEAKQLHSQDNSLAVDLKGDVFALDSTTIDLCLDIYLWANFRSTKSGIKVHTLLNIKNSIPEFIYISNASLQDVNVLDRVPIEKGNYYVMDRGYTDYERLYKIHKNKAFFVIRAKNYNAFKILSRRKVNKANGIVTDWEIVLTSQRGTKKYPHPLRRIKFFDKDFNRTLIFYTNNKKVKAETVAMLYKSRWSIEIFFKWVKQNLRIISFWGQNENAVKIQIWIAISTYVLVAITRKKLNIKHSLYEMLQYISIAPFEKDNLRDTFSDKNFFDMRVEIDKQLKIF